MASSRNRLRLILLTLAVLILAALSWHLRAKPRAGITSLAPPSGAPQFYQLSYQSESYLVPQLSSESSSAAASGLTILCQAEASLYVWPETRQDLKMLLRFQSLRCQQQELLSQPKYAAPIAYDMASLRSAAALPLTSQDPRFAILRQLALLWPEARVQPESASAWTAQDKEHRVEGSFLPELQVIPKAEKTLWRKSFQGLLQAEHLAPSSHALSSELSLLAEGELQKPFTLAGPFRELKAEEKLLTRQGRKLLARTEQSIELKLSPSQQALFEEALDKAVMIPATSQTQLLAEEEKQALMQKWQDFSQGAGARPYRDLSSHEAEPLYLELKQKLQRDPSLADRLLEELALFDTDSLAFAEGLGALVYSGRSETMDRLVQFLESKPALKQNPEIIAMLGLSPTPTDKSFALLRDLRDSSGQPELSRTAELAMASQLKKGQADESYLLELQQRLKQAKTREEKISLLDLVSNAGQPSLLIELSSWLVDADLELKLALAHSLRNFDDETSEAWLARFFQEGPDKLRLQSLQSLSQRTLSLPVAMTLGEALPRWPLESWQKYWRECLYRTRLADRAFLQKMKTILARLEVSDQEREAWLQWQEDYEERLSSP